MFRSGECTYFPHYVVMQCCQAFTITGISFHLQIRLLLQNSNAFMHFSNKAIMKTMHERGGESDFCATGARERKRESGKKQSSRAFGKSQRISLPSSLRPATFHPFSIPFVLNIRCIFPAAPSFARLHALCVFGILPLIFYVSEQGYIERNSYDLYHLVLIKNETKLKIDSLYFCSLSK